jgi:serine/threonine-protein kinase HipA
MARRDLLNWTLFQLLIGNSDAHGKNISFFVSKAGIDVAPSYDLMNIDIYGDEFERDLAMAIGNEFIAEEILPYQLAEFCDECKLPQRQVATSLKNLCTAVLGNLDDLPMDDIQDGTEMDFAQELLGRIRDNAVRFLKISQDLPHLKF